jgi:hypothetical protein
VSGSETAINRLFPQPARIERSARIAALTPGSAISAIGRIVAAEAVRFGAVELVVEAIEVQSLADAPLPIAAIQHLKSKSIGVK